MSLGWLTCSPRCIALYAVGIVALVCLSNTATANVTFNVKRMTRNDVPRGEGQCDIRIRVDGEIEFALSGNRVETRTISGRDPQDVGSECNFPFPQRRVNNMRWEVRDGRGRAELIEEPNRRNGMRVVFNVRDPKGGDGRYHVRVKWDLAGSEGSGSTWNNPGGNTGGTWGGGAMNRPSSPSRPSSRTGRSGSSTGGRGNTQQSTAQNNSGWGSGNNDSGWGSGSGWGNVRPPAMLSSTGRGSIGWTGRQTLTPNRVTVRVNNDRVTIQVFTRENRTVQFDGVVLESSQGFFEVDLDRSSEGPVNALARIDYANNNRLDRLDINGNAGTATVHVDFQR
jgi:hypothetical protein